MKTLNFITGLTFAVVFLTSFSVKQNQQHIKDNSFNEFLALFENTDLPYSKIYLEEDEGKYKEIPDKLVKEYLTKNNEEIDAEAYYALAKFKISKKYYGLIVGSGSYIDGYGTYLFIFAKDGTYMSSLQTGYYYEKSGNITKTEFDISKSYELTLVETDSGYEDGNPDIVNEMVYKYLIIKGVIKEK